MGLVKLTWMLLLPLIPSILLFVVFPNDTFNYIAPKIPAELRPSISASGAVGLYFVLILLSVRFLKSDRLDTRIRQRIRLVGAWVLDARWREQNVEHESQGEVNFTLDPNTQRLVLHGKSQRVVDGTLEQNEYHFDSSRVFLEPNNLLYMLETNHPDYGRRRWVVEFPLPADGEIREINGQFNEIEGNFAGFINLQRRQRHVQVAEVLTRYTVPVAVGAAAVVLIAWVAGLVKVVVAVH